MKAIGHNSGSAATGLPVDRDRNDWTGSSVSSTSVAMLTNSEATGIVSNITAEALLREFVVACAVNMSNSLDTNRRWESSSTLTSNEKVSVVSRLAELKAWLGRFEGKDVYEGHQEEIAAYAQSQVQRNFDNFARSVRELAPSASDAQTDALAQLLIAASDVVADSRAFLLGSSIEPYLEQDEPLLVDAAAKALSRSRLDFVHAAKRMRKVASRTPYRYLRKQLEKVARQLAETTDGSNSPQA